MQSPALLDDAEHSAGRQRLAGAAPVLRRADDAAIAQEVGEAEGDRIHDMSNQVCMQCTRGRAFASMYSSNNEHDLPSSTDACKRANAP